MASVRFLTPCLAFTLGLLVCICEARTISNQARSGYKTYLTDFRYNTARVDGITKLSNGSLIVISNGHYWVLRSGELPRYSNVKGAISMLYPSFEQVDAIWTDPYNEISPQIYLISNTAKHGLRVVCQEFNESFSNDSRFCHLPVDNLWKNALRDLDPSQPVDAVTWRNRTKDKDGGFWVFFQGNKMITVDPYEMTLRFTYDIQKWMSINDTIRATYYDYHDSVYHLFFDNNKYHRWTVNVSFMNSLPMSWDRAFLHGSLSPPLKINKDFFGFNQYEIRDWPQPYYERYDAVETSSSGVRTSRPTSTSPVPRTYPPYENTYGQSFPRAKSTKKPEIFDIELITPRTKYISNVNRNDKIRENMVQLEREREVNSLDNDNSDSIRYQKQLMQLDQDGVLDFAQSVQINSSPFRLTMLTTLLIAIPIFLQSCHSFAIL